MRARTAVTKCCDEANPPVRNSACGLKKLTTELRTSPSRDPAVRIMVVASGSPSRARARASAVLVTLIPCSTSRATIPAPEATVSRQPVFPQVQGLFPAAWTTVWVTSPAAKVAPR